MALQGNLSLCLDNGNLLFLFLFEFVPAAVLHDLLFMYEEMEPPLHH